MGLRGPRPGTQTHRPRGAHGVFLPVARTPAPDPPPVTFDRDAFTVVKINEILEAVKTSYGLKTLAAEKLGISYELMKTYGDQFIEVKAECDRQKERVNDIAELGLIKLLLSGDLGAICFRLKTQAKDRGFIERTEQDTRVSGRIEHSLAPAPDDTERVRAVAEMLQQAGVFPMLQAPGETPEPRAVGGNGQAHP